MKNTLINGLCISMLIFTQSLYSQEIPVDKLQALKDTLAATAAQTDNELFAQSLAWFTEVIESRGLLSQNDSAKLEAVYDTFCLNTGEGDCRKFETYLNRQRTLIIAWISPTDGNISFGALRLPANYDPEYAYPLYIHLHGLASDTDNPIDFLCRYFLRSPNASFAYEDGYLFFPWGRGNLWYQGIAETDIHEGKKVLEHLLSVDPQREYIAGHSMGGYGSWYIASRSPEIWAALGVEAGALWYGNAGTLADETIQKLKELPTYFVVGVQDGLFDVNLQAFNLLNDAGNEHTNFASFTGGHEHLDINEELMYLWLQDFVNEDYTAAPEKISTDKSELKCFPNPFTETIHLSFILDKSDHVMLSVYTVQGQLIETLVNTTLAPGTHEVGFSPTSIAPGFYFCRLVVTGKKFPPKILICVP
jgi:hypothetical protein